MCLNVIENKISVKIKMLDKVDIYEESYSGRNKDSGDIMNAEIRVITKKL